MYLYGNLVLHPTDRNVGDEPRHAVHPLTFKVCDTPHSLKALYEFSLQGPSTDPSVNPEQRASTWAASELQQHHYCARRRYSTQRTNHLIDEVLKVPIVCRQMWEEMSETVYETCTFGFSGTEDFFYLLSCRKEGLQRVRKLMLAPEIWSSGTGDQHYSDLTSWDLTCFKGVRSLDLWIVWPLVPEYNPGGIERALAWMRGEVNSRSVRKMGGGLFGHGKNLDIMVRKLAKWKLKGDSIRVIVDVRDNRINSWQKLERTVAVSTRLELARAVRKKLLRGRSTQ